MSSSVSDRASAAISRADGQRIPAYVNAHSPAGAEARAALLESGAFELHDLELPTLRAQIEDVTRSGLNRIVVAGGDGTLGTAAAALLGAETELAIVPAGTMNHFVKDHGLPESTADAIHVALSGAPTRVDVGVVSDRVFLNTASVGMYVSYVRARERLERFVGYGVASVAALITTFLRPRPLSVELEAEGVVRHYRTPLLFVGVGQRELKAPKFGGRVEGGKRGLHVIIVRGRRPARLLTVALAAATRGVEHVATSPQIDSFIVDSCTVRVGRRRRVRVGMDGELVRVPAPLEFRLGRNALRVVGARLPADAPVNES